MTSFDILFQTNRFNLSEVKERFINPCCFGEDLAEWLREQLAKKGVSADAPYQEDWGWEMLARQGSQGYFLGATGYPSEGAVDKNDGEWRIMVETRRSIWEKLRGKNKISETDPMLSIIEDILREQADVRNMSREFMSL
ncbi:MAG TPA: hypothetical protein VMQ17_06480 [Candidatus Sulfotelmatobacter sp.]|jgi:hypothetical protein|nr:hypothetical protein [Candidatus Sulfotelmatobacter sp.]